MARTTVWVIAIVLVGLWTLAALVGYGAIDLLGTVAADRAGTTATDPDHIAGIARLFRGLRDLGLFAVVALWLVVTALILLVAAAIGVVVLTAAAIGLAVVSGASTRGGRIAF